MCEYCRERGKRKYIVISEYAELKIKKIKILGYCLEIIPKEGQTYTKINYCPMCGRKLTK